MLTQTLLVISSDPKCRHGHGFGLLTLGLLQAQVQDPPDETCVQPSRHTYAGLTRLQRCQNSASALRCCSSNLIDAVFAINNNLDRESFAALIVKEVGEYNHGDGQGIV